MFVSIVAMLREGYSPSTIFQCLFRLVLEYLMYEGTGTTLFQCLFLGHPFDDLEKLVREFLLSMFVSEQTKFYDGISEEIKLSMFVSVEGDGFVNT